MGVVSEFTTFFKPKGKHLHKCQHCSKTIQPGEKVVVQKIVISKEYPVKGKMGFLKWEFWHEDCKKAFDKKCREDKRIHDQEAKEARERLEARFPGIYKK